MNYRPNIQLCGEWDFRLDPNSNIINSVLAGDNSILWRHCNIPCDIAHACPEQEYYQGKVCFKKNFNLPKDYLDRRIVLNFQAINYDSYIYLNGKYLGHNKQGFLPFEFDITNYALEGNNELLVSMDGSRDDGDLPTCFYWRNSCGIIRNVSIYTTPICYINYTKINANINGDTNFTIEIGGEIPNNSSLQIELLDSKNNVTVSQKINAINNNQITIQNTNAKLWSPSSPNLYQAKITLITPDYSDEITQKFGYRKIEAKDGKIWLNGQEIFLKGFNRHEDSVEFGGAYNKNLIDKDFQSMKEMGANFVRMCHYPHDSYELTKADELGLITLVEIPVNAFPKVLKPKIDKVVHTQHKEVHENALEMLWRMIRRDYNHPSVCFWSVANESVETVANVRTIIKSLINYAKTWDNTRLCVHVSNYPNSEFYQTLYTNDDVICINKYITLQNRQKDDNYDFGKTEIELVDLFDKLHQAYPGKPIIMTEFGYPTGEMMDGPLSQQKQIDCINAEYPVLRKHLSGASYWAFADHLWEPVSITGKSVSRYGVLHRDRTPKESMKIYSNLLKQD